MSFYACERNIFLCSHLPASKQKVLRIFQFQFLPCIPESSFQYILPCQHTVSSMENCILPPAPEAVRPYRLREDCLRDADKTCGVIKIPGEFVGLFIQKKIERFPLKFSGVSKQRCLSKVSQSFWVTSWWLIWQENFGRFSWIKSSERAYKENSLGQTYFISSGKKKEIIFLS